jgi:hypothetical protein
LGYEVGLPVEVREVKMGGAFSVRGAGAGHPRRGF